MLGGSATEQLQGYVKELKQIYDENVVPFENTDDQYDASLGILYNEWCSAGDHFRDIGNAIGDFCCGVGNAVKDFVMGIAGLAGGIVKLLGYAGYSLLELAGLAVVPDSLDADIQGMKDTLVQVIKDPGNVLESVGQGMFDTADEKGTAYSSGYVAGDVVIAILTDKGLDKLKEAGKAGKTTANVADDVADVADDAARAGKEAGEAAKAAESAGKLESGLGIKYSPANPGPLNEEVANSFNGATYTERVLTEDTIMFRVSGGNAKEVGSYMSMTPQGGGLQSQLDLALNPAWGNTTENVTKVVIPKGTTIYEGIAAPQNIYDSLGNVIGTLPGGGNQVYIPKVEAGWFQ